MIAARRWDPILNRAYRGAGGPFLGCGLRGADGGVPTWQMFIGGSGYVRLLNGRLRLGGGGHQTMAAAQLANVDMDEALRQLHGAIDEYFENVST